MYCYINLRYDHDQLVREALTAHGYVPPSDDDALGRHLDLFDLRKRLVPVRPYSVQLSRELRANPKWAALQSTVEELTNRMRCGLSIAPYLSTLASKVEKKDDMLMHWGLHHAHLNPISSINKKGYVARADDLLFFRVEGRQIYLVNIVPHQGHDAFEREELVRIVDRNWPELHEEVRRVGRRRALTPQEIRNLRKKNTNLVGVQNGRRLVRPAGGATSSGRSMDGLLDADRVSSELQQIEQLIQLNYHQWFPSSDTWITSLQLVGVEEDCYLVRDGATEWISEIGRTYDRPPRRVTPNAIPLRPR